MRAEQESNRFSNTSSIPENGQELIRLQEIDKPKHECGVFGVFAPSEDVARITYFGLYALQHRGQESSGIVTLDKGEIHSHHGMGLVPQIFNDDTIIDNLTGQIAVGHNRYSNTGEVTEINAQPFIYKGVVISENGNLVNPQKLRDKLEAQNIFPSEAIDGSKCSSDGELIAQSIYAASGSNWVEKIQNASLDWDGAYTLVVAAEDSLYGVLDHQGTWPFSLGRLNNSGYILTSETCALDHVNAKVERFVKPGEIIKINNNGVESFKLPNPKNIRRAKCPFDSTYFSRPDSLYLEPNELIPEGVTINQLREEMGRQLARDSYVDADVVFGVPNSGLVFARGWSDETGTPNREGFIKNQYVGRNFISPDERQRDVGKSIKLNVLKENVKGKIVVVTDDSIVRGDTMPSNVRKLRNAGVKEVHVRIAFPRILFPCHYGIDTYKPSELISSRMSQEELRQHVDADTLYFLSIKSFAKVLTKHAPDISLEDFCRGCYLNEYPTPVPTIHDKNVLARV